MPRDKFSLVVCQVEFRLHAPFCNLFDRLAGGESFLDAPCWNLSCRTSGVESIVDAESWHLSRRSASGESLLHAPCWNLFIGLGVSFTRPVLESFWSFCRWGHYFKQPVMEFVCSYVG